MILHSSVYCWQGQRPSWLCIHYKPGKGTWHVCRETKQTNVSWLISALGPYICRDVIEFGDEGMLDNIHSDFRDDDHDNIRKQPPHVVWRKKININTNRCKSSFSFIYCQYFFPSVRKFFFSFWIQLTSHICHLLSSFPLFSTRLWWDRPQRYCSKITKSRRKIKKKELLSRFLFRCLQH